MLQSSQIRAARALLDWKQHDLAKAAKIGIATIRRIESQEGPMMGYVSTLMRLQSAFERAGIRFIDNDAAGGIGVRFAAPKHWEFIAFLPVFAGMVVIILTARKNWECSPVD